MSGYSECGDQPTRRDLLRLEMRSYHRKINALEEELKGMRRIVGHLHEYHDILKEKEHDSRRIWNKAEPRGHGSIP